MSETMRHDDVDGGYAFPNPDSPQGNPVGDEHGTGGMSLRAYLAAHVCPELIAMFAKAYLEVVKTNEPRQWEYPLIYSPGHMESVAKIEARYRLAVADALLAALSKSSVGKEQKGGE